MVRGARFCGRCGVSVDEMPSPPQPAPSVRSATFNMGVLGSRIASVVLLTGVVVFALYVLGQSVIQTEVFTVCFDDKYHMLVLTQLRVRPIDYYSICEKVYHELYEPGPAAWYRPPLIYYIWLLVPNVGDIKWLYLPFAMTASVASYFAVSTVTKRKLLAALSAAWMAYFLVGGTKCYLMFEYWAISVFLIGLAFFVSEHHVLAAATIGAATLVKEVFAPFMLVASIYYLWRAVMKEDVWRFLASPFRAGFSTPSFSRNKNHFARTLSTWILSNKKATVWGAVTFVVGVAYCLGALVVNLSFESPIHFFETFDPSILPLLFATSFFSYPPIPFILTVSLALIGISALANWDQRILAYASFAFMILLMLTSESVPSNAWPTREIAMSITLVNLFWLVGLYKIFEYPTRWISSLRTGQQTSRWHELIARA